MAAIRSALTLKTETRLKGMETHFVQLNKQLIWILYAFENRDPLKGDGNFEASHEFLIRLKLCFENRDPLKGDGNASRAARMARRTTMIL